MGREGKETYAGALGDQEKLGSMELPAVISYPVWVLGTELRFAL